MIYSFDVQPSLPHVRRAAAENEKDVRMRGCEDFRTSKRALRSTYERASETGQKSIENRMKSRSKNEEKIQTCLVLKANQSTVKQGVELMIYCRVLTL